MTERTRAALTRTGVVILLLIAVDGAVTWYATDRAADVVHDIRNRDGVVVTDDTTLGALHRTEIGVRVADDGARIARARFLWIAGVIVAAGALFASGAAERELTRTVVMAAALTLAVVVAPRAIYASELPPLERVLG